jgi:carbonic anhydrase
VPPEIIFDAGFGELFVIRVAGNVMSTEIAGTMQYAGRHLQTPLFVVLGHDNCGAIKAALDVKFRSARMPSRIALLVESILPALETVDPAAEPSVQIAQAVEANILWTLRQIAESPEGKVRQAEGVYKFLGAVCELASGRVRFLE